MRAISGRGIGRLTKLVGVVAPLTVLATASTALADGLGAELVSGAEISRSEETGKVSFISTAVGQPIERPAGVSATDSPVAAARAFLADHRGAFGLRRSGFERIDIVAGPKQSTAVRLGQTQAGVPVLAGELLVNVDRRNRITSVSGEATPDRAVVAPQVSAAEAAESALAVTAKARGQSRADLTVADPQLWIYDARLLGAPGFELPLLVWRAEVSGGVGGDVRELVLVDARRGGVALNFSQIAEAKNRSVCNASNTAAQYPCTVPVRTEGGAATGDADVDNAYDFSGDTYDLFFNQFGRDSLDGAGMTLKSTVKYCPSPSECPYGNAFWDGQQMVYGQGYASADDVVGHELAHGYTEFTSNLFYYYQSGAINESMSDVFGEFVDLFQHVTAADNATNRWLVGEDLPIGAIRDMENPGAFGDPDRMTSPNYFGGSGDQGGVHANSGVNNKAAFLMTDGGSFNSQTITGLGIPKVAQIYNAVETTQLTSGSDYANLASGLQQACTNLVGSHGITAANCAEVTKAVTATEMSTDPPAAPAPEAPTCAGTDTPTPFFSDNMESGSGWTPVAPWQYDTGYATSGTRMLYGEDLATTSDVSVVSPTISVPASIPSGGAFLRFNHAYQFESSGSSNWDGGVVEYSTNGGTSWTDAGSLIVNNSYNGTLHPSNPLGARAAFTGESHGYYSTRVNLASLAGQSNVRFRFRIGTDSSVGALGWVVDDVSAYTCAVNTAPPPDPGPGPDPNPGPTPDISPPDTTITKAPARRTFKRKAKFEFTSSEGGNSFQCTLDGLKQPCTSPALARVRRGKHTLLVQAIDAAGNIDPTPAMAKWRVLRLRR